MTWGLLRIKPLAQCHGGQAETLLPRRIRIMEGHNRVDLPWYHVHSPLIRGLVFSTAITPKHSLSCAYLFLVGDPQSMGPSGQWSITAV